MNRILAPQEFSPPHHYNRLMFLTLASSLVYFPVGIYLIVYNIVSSPVLPWPGWHAVHANMSTVNEIPAEKWRLDSRLVLLARWNSWIGVVNCASYFLIFATTRNVFDYYSDFFWKLVCLLGLKRAPSRERTLSPSNHYLRFAPDERLAVSVS